ELQPVQIELQPVQFELQPVQFELQPVQVELQPVQFELQPEQFELQSVQIELQSVQMYNRKQVAILSILFIFTLSLFLFYGTQFCYCYFLYFRGIFGKFDELFCGLFLLDAAFSFTLACFAAGIPRPTQHRFVSDRTEKKKETTRKTRTLCQNLA
ncbi:MAG: hypothetical protein LBI18_02705, partial [Planctomycetaceae bacterium]|nr:hypothetical protein [Planctomycetaceae bacterium]